MKRRTFAGGLLGTAALGAWAPSSIAATPPGTRLPGLVTLVVPFAPGGGADQLAREFAHFAQAKLPGTTIVVENKPGANGAIAARHVARQKADGATLLLGTSSTHALGPLINKLELDMVDGFSPVTLLASTANALAVSAQAPWPTLSAFIDDARKTAFSYGTFGTGSSAHLYGLVLAQSTRAKLSHVPYKGSSQAITDLMGGHIPAVFLTTNALESLARENKVRILAVTGKQRTRIFPGIATFEEQGVGQLDFNGWFALFAPAGTPEPMRAALARVARELPNDQALNARLTGQGYDWVGSSPAELQRTLVETIGIYRRILASHPEGLGG